MNEIMKNIPTTANREYKDSVFTLLFGNEETIKEVYGAIKGTKYGPETKIEMTTLKNVFCGGGLNDLSFVLDGKLVVLIEHQSTLSQNMPLRMLFYMTKLYSQHIREEDIYSQKRILLPTPELIVLYNGASKMPEDMRILKLSDAFIEYDPTHPPNLELTVKMYNINRGRNKKIQKRCAALYGYSIFIDMVREYQKTMSLKKAIKKAISDCINQDILRIFLETHKKELVDMLVTEWDYDLEKKVLRREAWEDGMEKGMKKGILQAAKAMIAEGMDAGTVARVTSLTIDDILRL